MNPFLLHTSRFIFLVVFQALILNNIQLSGYLNPFLYVLFILMLPFQTARWMVLVLSFVLGICIDMFADTGGIHATATVLLGFLREPVLKLFSPREGYENAEQPSIHRFGMGWFFSYAGILVLAHHIVLFYLEVFHFSELFHTLLRIFLSAVFTLMLILISQLFFSKNRE